MNNIIQGDSLEVLKTMPDEYVDCIITSPPYYGLRDYGAEGQLGLEKTLNEYLDKMLFITGELKRVLKKTGTMWWNHGDSYAGTPTGNMTNYQNQGDNVYTRLWNRNRYPDRKNPKSLRGREQVIDFGIPNKCLTLQAHRLIIRMIDEQKWILRNTIIWHKPNCMPSSVKDRFTVDYEPVFFLTKSKKYWFETQYEEYTAPMNRWGGDELKANGKSTWDNGTGQDTYRDRNMRPNELGRNKRAVWKIPTQPLKEAHFATFPKKLIEPMVKAGCPEFICAKCGKAREKIWESKGYHFLEKDKNDKSHIARVAISSYKSGQDYAKFREKNPIEFKGITDCHCNAGWSAGIVLDPFMGAGTTALVAQNLKRNWIGIELNEEYIKIANKRLSQQVLI